MTETPPRFSCVACGRKHGWKKEIAGKRGKCPCGQVVTVPEQPEPDEDDGIYDLADAAADAERAVASLPPTVVERAPEPASSRASSARVPRPARQRRADDDDVFLDRNRDIIAPTVLAMIGAVLLVVMAMRSNMPPAGFLGFVIGMSIVVAIESVLLMIFALIVAGPLGVSFGDVRTAFYKFAAIVVFSDGVIAVLDTALARTAGRGVIGVGIVGFVASLGIYWATISYLFGMDPDDSWLVVVILSVFYRICSIVLLALILSAAVHRAGSVAGSDDNPPSFGGPPPASMSDEIQRAQSLGLIEEARQYINQNKRDADLSYVDAWYKAGAKNVWYQLFKGYGGNKTVPMRFIIELPADADGRAKCYQVCKTYYDDRKLSFLNRLRHDDKNPYLFVLLGQ
jgi:hypothetical protein